jgi:hypothetical protein
VPKDAEGELPEWIVKSVWLTGTAAVDPFADPPPRRDVEAPRAASDANREHVVARGTDEPVRVDRDDSPTPPHGEKLR